MRTHTYTNIHTHTHTHSHTHTHTQIHAGVLGWDMSTASSLLVVLQHHDLVSWDASNSTYSLHSMVRQCAVESVPPDVVHRAKKRFVAHMFEELDGWAAVYNTQAWEAPLESVRERGPDVRAAFSLACKCYQSDLAEISI